MRYRVQEVQTRFGKRYSIATEGKVGLAAVVHGERVPYEDPDIAKVQAAVDRLNERWDK